MMGNFFHPQGIECMNDQLQTQNFLSTSEMPIMPWLVMKSDSYLQSSLVACLAALTGHSGNSLTFLAQSELSLSTLRKLTLMSGPFRA